jgi:hypothetical protein
MRKVILGFAALSALFAVSCSNSDKNTPTPNANTNIVGTWSLTGMQVNYYNSSNQVVYSEHNIDGNVGQVQVKFTSSTYFSYYAYTAGVFTLEDSASYTLNSSANPMVLNLSGGSIGTATVSVPLLTSSQMVWQIKTTPDSYWNSSTSQNVDAAYSITLDTLTKQQ